MRVLKPEVAREREESILRWIIREFIETRRPVGSELASQKSGHSVSSATIRNVMKKLEDEGYLYQSHVSGGRIPTDKAYRFYVDYLLGLQRFALDEREQIEREYRERMDESDEAMEQISKMLAMLSHSAGFVFSCGVGDQCVRRLDFIPVGPGLVLAVLVTESGSVKHWPLRLNYDIGADRLRMLGMFVNQQISGLPLREAERKLWEYLDSGHPEMRDVAELARQLLLDIEKQKGHSRDLFIEGVGQLVENTSREDYQDFCEVVRVLEEKRRLSEILNEKLGDFVGRLPSAGQPRVRVTIGAENEIKELRNLSMVSSAYRMGEKAIGMLGILGPRHMEYSRAISLVNFVSDLVEGTVSQWERMLLPKSGESAPAQARPRKQSKGRNRK